MHSKAAVAWIRIAIVVGAASAETDFGQSSSSAHPDAFPAGVWAQASPSELGWSVQKLEEAHAFFNTLPPASIVIIDRGKVITGWGDPSRRVKISSMRKSFLSALCGIAVAKGALHLDATLLQLGIDDVPPLTAAEKQATVRMLLEARSGVYHSYVAGTPAMQAAVPPRGSHAPGSFWAYNNWDFNALGAIFESQTHQTIGEAFRTQIAAPLQMQDYRPEDMYHLYAGPQAKEYEKSIYPAYHFRMTARDLARFGYLYLQHGTWNGKQIIPASWIEESTQAHSDAGEGRGYGYLWWINYLKLAVNNIDAVGAMAKYVLIFPERHLVVAYLNYAEFPDHASQMTEADLSTLPAASVPQIAKLLTLLLDAQRGPGALEYSPTAAQRN